jgi:hypothetical protein
MKRLLLMVSCALFLSAFGPISSAPAGIRFWHRHHKDAAKTSEAPKEKAKHKKISFHRRGKATREEAARKEATFGMTGPKSQGWLHPHPGPAGVGAN